jgi:DNA-binding GntR family transcriptional regulator
LATCAQLGRAVVAADQIIEAGLADPPIARHLEVAAGAPTLRLRFVFRDARGAPVNHVVYHYRADRYVYTARLSTPPRAVAPRTAAGTRSRTGSPRARARR